jgi:hypothetical protein
MLYVEKPFAVGIGDAWHTLPGPRVHTRTHMSVTCWLPSYSSVTKCFALFYYALLVSHSRSQGRFKTQVTQTSVCTAFGKSLLRDLALKRHPVIQWCMWKLETFVLAFYFKEHSHLCFCQIHCYGDAEDLFEEEFMMSIILYSNNSFRVQGNLTSRIRDTSGMYAW